MLKRWEKVLFYYFNVMSVSVDVSLFIPTQDDDIPIFLFRNTIFFFLSKIIVFLISMYNNKITIYCLIFFGETPLKNMCTTKIKTQ